MSNPGRRQDVDDLSIKLLKLLERRAALTIGELATMLDAPPDEVARRIHHLEHARVLVGRHALINWERVGEEPVAALIEVRVSPQREVGFGAVAARIARFPEARSVQLLSGTYDLAVEVTGRTMKDVASFVSEKLAPLDGVQGTTTHFLLKRYKEDGEVFDEPEPPPRLPYAP
ncbi:MAG TPA: Lrp/AsnC family transcriptional regulator [Chloroflexota bacterium]|nr:Lrp/AsnC family transcriptional regulator [Chloroflexota bacterium]